MTTGFGNGRIIFDSRAMSRTFRDLASAVLVSAALSAQTSGPAGGSVPPPAGKAPVVYADARPILEALPDSLPAELKGKSRSEIEAAWPDWISHHDVEIRKRLERGDEDSLVNLWLFGTSFTRLPPARDAELAERGTQAGLANVVRRRLDDFINAIASPGTNERLRFARQFVEGKGLDPTTDAGKRRLGQLLMTARERAIAEFETYDRTLERARRQKDPSAEIAAYATIFRNRGLSSDTSVLADFAVEQTLRALRRDGVLATGSVRRVAVVGPGLDFLNKADGRDSYPQQSIQPFALVDSLLRLGLADQRDLRVITFDLSPRVNQHLEMAVSNANAGQSYELYLPLAGRERWTPELVSYWERLGDQIGVEKKIDLPPDGQDTRIRALIVRPTVVQSVGPRDVNIVVERLEPLAAAERFDVVVATNVFVYYDPFEQALAAANVARMLRPAGVLLSNTLILPTPPMRSTAAHAVITYSDRQYDNMFWYQRE